ncbi:MAM and LDL-receptor class A domain-containing protein 1-like [Argopecten irradians]|uniref:MAM and LDL-receptor class A domain-containing protein 1-like n=1 Tax=Argopecten irradians TaxID=31199 RepID=UPI003723C806
MDIILKVLWNSLFLFVILGNVAASSPYAGKVWVMSSCASVKNHTITNASCSFDSDLCSYQNLNPGAIWELKQDKIGGFFGFGGTGEHTNNKGYYARPKVTSSRSITGTSFELALPELPMGAVCVEFWFDKRGNSASGLQVVVEYSTGHRDTAWRGYTNDKKWKKVALMLKMDISFKVIFKMEKEDSSHVTGLDDVSVYTVTSANRPNGTHLYWEQPTAATYLDETTTATISREFLGNDSAINCTFESSSCTWHIGSHSDFDWHIGDTNEVRGLSAPKTDHTNGDGKYAYIRGIEARNSSWKAVLASDVIDSDVHLQFSFWYIMNGLGVGSLSLHQNFSNGNSNIVWSRKGRQGPDWLQAVVELSPGSYTLLFEATTKYHYLSDLAIDDTVLTNVTLTTTTTVPTTTQPPAVLLPLSCDFEVNVCGFAPPARDPEYVLWERTQSPLTVRDRVFVTGDNTTGSGSFLSLRPNGEEAHRGDVASIVSPPIEAQTSACLRMAYIMPSTLSGTITMYRRRTRDGALHLLEHLSGYYGPQWRSQQVDLQSNETFQIEIKGSYVGEPGAIVGVDDLSLESGPCPVTTTPPPTTTTTLPLPQFEVSAVCGDHDFHEIPGLSCSFDSTACSYSSVGDELEWILLNDSYHRIPGGKTGQYIVLDTTQLTTPHGSVAQLVSPISNGSDICLTFWYLNPSPSSNLEVLMEFISGASASIWSTDGEAHADWQSVTISVKTETAYKLVFRSKKTDTFGPVGIDEIRVYKTTIEENLSSKSTQSVTPTISVTGLLSTQSKTSQHLSSALSSIAYATHSTNKISGRTLSSMSTSPIPSVTTSGLHVTSPVLVTSSSKSSIMPIITKISSSGSTVLPSVSVTIDNLLNSKTTRETSNNSDKSTDTDSNTQTKALYIGLSVAVFGMCGIVLAVYLLKKKIKISNLKQAEVQMRDIDSIEKKDNMENKTKNSDEVEQRPGSQQSATSVSVIGFRKLDV